MSLDIYGQFVLLLLTLQFPVAFCNLGHHIHSNPLFAANKQQSFNKSNLQATELVPVIKFMSEKKNLLLVRLLFCKEYEDVAMDLAQWYPGDLMGLMIQQYDGTKKSVNRLLRPEKEIIYLFGLCSCHHVLEIYEMIRNQSLNGHTVNWIWILEEKTADDEFILELETLVYEGTHVTLITMHSDHLAEVSKGQVDIEGIVRFHRTGRLVMGSSEHDFNSLRHLTLGYFGRQADVSGRKMTMASVNSYPTFVFGQTYPDGSVEAKTGVDVQVLKSLSAALNFTFRVIPSVDGAYGNPKPDGTVTGIAGMVARREVTFAIRLAMNDARESVIDFTSSFHRVVMKLVSQPPKEKNRALAVLSPFTLWVWISIVACTSCIGLIMFFLSKCLKFCGSRETQQEFYSYPFNMYRSLVIQGNYLSARYWPSRFVLFTWYLFCIIISALYAGMLTAVLALPAYETPIDSLLDLPKAVQKGFTLGVRKETSHAYVFKFAREGIFRRTWDLFNHDDPSQSFVETFNLGMKKVLDGKFIFITSDFLAELISRKLGKRKFYIGKESFAPLDAGILCQTGSPFQQTFSLTLLRMNEGGLVVKWVKDEYRKLEQIVEKHGNGNSQTEYPTITLTHLQAAFFIMAIGYLVASKVVLLENICNRSPDSRTQ